MKNSSEKEEPDDKKGYIFFSDPNVIVKRAEASAIRAQIAQDSEIQQQSTNLQVSTLGIKSLENLLSYHPVQPYPFTFISAVKQKLALGDCTETGARAHDSNSPRKNNLASSVLRANSTQTLYQIVQKMDLVRPLKVPDLKISPKTLDFSGRENSKELPSTKSEIAAKEFALDRPDKASRTGERVQRKLDFSSSDASIINCESIEPLKAPNVSIAFNLNKKKEHVRDSSREKENRSKRMKKDESLGTKREESAQDQVKRSRSPRHVSRKDAIDTSNITRLPLSKNDRLPFHATKSNDSLSAKSKVKSFVTSTAKKDNDKKQKSLNAQSVELSRDNPLSKGRIPGNELSAFRPWKAVDKVTLKDNNSVGILSSNSENKSKDICHSRQRPEVEDSKYKSDLDNRQSKQDKSNTIHKEQAKRVSDKSKAANKVDGKLHSVNSEPSEDIGSVSESNSSKNRASAYPASSVQQTKSNDSETITESKENVNLTRSTKTSENFRYTEHSVTQSASTSIKKDEESYSQSIITTKETTANDDSNDADTVLPDALFDPRRISFRDAYSQEEFPNLITPEKMNLVLRSKRRRYLIQSSDSEVDARCPKYKSVVKQEKEQEEVQLMHPTALHMQFQAELHLYDSFNESLRQVMDVEKLLYDTNKREQESPQKEDVKDEELEEAAQVEEDRAAAVVNDEAVEKTAWNPFDYTKRDINEAWKSNDDAHFTRDHYIPNQENIDESSNNRAKPVKTLVKVAEVQTQTVNDMATQTDTLADKRNVQKDRFLEIRGNLYERSFPGENEVPQLSLDSAEQFEDLDQIEEISLPSKIRTMSEISLHETTSSIKTETGTEISISTRDVTCSFNKYLDLEIAELIKDENQRCNKIEMLFKSREKTLNDKTKKLVKLEEQKRALKDTGQDSRSVKKKQRALLLKLQQEKDEMYRLKQLYEITSQERKLMLQKQRDMFNPQMSTKNILTKLKRSADSQSPRRLSGPMKGYDIRSNSSMSSLIDSDKSQHDRSQVDTRLHASESDINSSKLDLLKADKFVSLEESNVSATRFDDLAEKSQKRYELKSRRYEDKMPRADILRQKQNQLEIESKRIHGHPMKIKRLLENQGPIEVSQPSRPELDASMPDYVKSESDTLVEELSKRSRTSQVAIPTVILSKEALASDLVAANNEAVEEEINTNVSDAISKTTKSSQVSEDLLQASTNKGSKKVDKSVTSDKDMPRKLQHSAELKTSSKRKSSKYQRTKSSSSTLMENILRSKSSSHMPEELIKHHDKRTRIENELLQLDNKESSLEIINESKENVSDQNKRLEIDENWPRNEQGTQNVSQISFAVSHHSSGESEKNFSKSIVVRSQERDFKTVLTAREAALTSRKNCVEEWMAWHTRLRAEEDRVTCMEKAAFKLIAASNVLSQQDTTVSSDTSDVEGRIELLTEKLAERRIEMARLKKEAKKQAKKQLRALEANLLNQIKRYDTTIHEMRKKLESKRAIKETDKLAIEPKSLADFKVPEIPLKRIQDIYKSSDLLRSRSEPDLLLTRSQLDLLKIATPITYDKHERDFTRKATKSADIKSTSATELKDTTDNRSAHTVFDEYTSEVYDNFRTTTSISSASNDPRSERYVSSTERQLDASTAVGMKQRNASLDAQTSLGTVRSELEAQTVSDARFEEHSTINTESADDKSITDNQTRTKTPVTQSEIQEMGNLRSIPSKSDYVTESAHIPTVATDSNILTYSKKLDFLQLNNKNLSEDISSIENDIKALSEIMSRLSNESNEKSKENKDEISTSRDISEIISKTIFSDKVTNTADEEKQTISSERESNLESRSRSSSESSRDKYISDRINNEISMIIPEEVPALSNLSTHEIDYEAKSKEIMNQIEKSIISEHVKMACDDYNAISVLENENEKLLSDMVSELDVKSISEILSKVSESRKSFDLATNSATQMVDSSKKDISEQSEILNETNIVDDSKILTDFSKNIQATNNTINSIIASNVDQNRSISAGNISQDKDDWTTSDSFEVPQDEISTEERDTELESTKSHLDHTLYNFSEQNVSHVDDTIDRQAESNLAGVVDISVFIPKGESTNVDATFNNASSGSHVMKSNNELDDILDIIAKENQEAKISSNKSESIDDAISDSVAELLNKVEDILQNTGEGADDLKGILYVSQAIGETNEKPAIDISLHVEIEEDPREVVSEAQEIIITEVDSDSVEDHALSELEVDANVELVEEEESVSSGANQDKDYYATEENEDTAPVEVKECLEPILEQDSSDGEQLDNLVEVAESGLDTVEKLVPFQDSSESVIDEVISVQTEEAERETADDTAVKRSDEIAVIDTEIHNINKTFDILKDPEYEDISEESLEVSEILDKHDGSRAGTANKSTNLPDTYRATQKSEEVLRILDEISQKSTSDSTSNSQKDKKDTPSAQSVTEEISELLEAQKRSIETNDDAGLSEEKSTVPLRSDEHDAEDKPSQILYELRERVSQLQEQNGSSESSEAGDTPRGVSEIEMDSPRDFNDSRLDIDILDDDLLSGTKTTSQSVDVKSNFHSTSIVATSEKDIEAMIDKLKASLEQPGLEVAELEAKLLHIEQLQIELEIKKLEAEEVSYYVREIPNKPPPPYTPPGDGRLSTSLGSPSLVTAVIPSNVEELTSFTEKATALIYNAKLAGEDIASLEAPPEIYELTKDKNEIVKRDRRIYNTFLFDLCKETIVEVYQAEYEKPGPSWTKPNVKTKPTVKIPKTVEELIEYVSKEVATLFGFKTKLQRENMVMRWSRKRRDRVDELLAREAQAEEDEWTKFHHDELTVKNGLTVAILDTLVMETANVVKVAYDAKRRMMV
ncbi:Centrosome-associated protein [Ooceraea biroi]|uniref:Centrosome-associated protein n=1 Tax=Ooceraea biroi TaxID=2015173 RepID=A0A026WE20_OOCBI|nr:Centrosome-associated protein [Ooceraea biroi]